MSYFTIALRSIQQRALASGLTMLSMALGVMMVVAVLTIHGVVERSFRTNASLGYNMIVGAKGGQEQLVLNTVYFLSAPVENVRYGYYLEFLNRAERDEQLKNSFAYRGYQTRQETEELLSLADASTGLAALGTRALQQAAAAQSIKSLELGRNGKYGPLCQFAIPVCLGDYFGRFRAVGTTPAYFNDVVYDMENGKKYEFAQGRNFVHDDPEHGFFEAVVGSMVAREMNVKLGDQISPRHGAPDGHTHERKFTVVGILKPTGTPNDRAVFVNMEGFYLMEDHAKPVEEEKHEDEAHATAVDTTDAANRADRPEPLPLEQREITSLLLLTTNPLVAPGLKNGVNEGKDAQAVFPVQVIYNLFDSIINPIRTAFLVLTSLTCVVSGLSILVSIYNSMSERRHEIAVMRALGAGRETVFVIILLESALLALGGGFIGWVLGHGVCVALSPEVEQQTGVTIGFLNMEPSVAPFEWLGFAQAWASALRIPLEWLIIPGLLLLAVLVGFWPAVTAYRTDVAKSLGK